MREATLPICPVGQNYMGRSMGIEPMLTESQSVVLTATLTTPLFGGSGEIRTHGPFRAVCFQDRCNQPDSATLPLNCLQEALRQEQTGCQGLVQALHVWSNR